MGHILPSEIDAHLKAGRKVYSRAIGRFGTITGVDGNCIELRAGMKGKGQRCVTFFHRGDDVEFAEDLNGNVVIVNVFGDD